MLLPAGDLELLAFSDPVGCDEVWHGLMSGNRCGFALIALMLIADFSVAAADLAAPAVMRAQFAPDATRSG
jgi:hypothetical protein